MMQTYVERVQNAITDLRKGKMILLTDHHDREDEADLIFPAETITSDIINFMIRHGSGIICLSLTQSQLKKLGLTYMVSPEENTSPHQTPFTLSIEAKNGITTGVSAKDRATTILTAVKNNVTEKEITKPGHVFPLCAKEGGILERPGHTEGSIDISLLAGFKPAAALCELMNTDGTMAKGAQLKKFAKQHQLMILSIEDLIAYRKLEENLIAEHISAELPLDPYGIFQLTVIKEKINHMEHIVLTKNKKSSKPPLIRIHSSCMTGDLFGSKRCDCHNQLHYSLQKISEEGGILIYLNQEGRGIGLFNKIKSYALQEKGFDTVEANEHLGLPIDSREYYIAAAWLKNRNMTHIRLLTNNPKKIAGLKKYGIATIELEKIPVFCSEENKHYLKTKKEKLHHKIKMGDEHHVKC